MLNNFRSSDSPHPLLWISYFFFHSIWADFGCTSLRGLGLDHVAKREYHIFYYLNKLTITNKTTMRNMEGTAGREATQQLMSIDCSVIRETVSQPSCEWHLYTDDTTDTSTYRERDDAAIPNECNYESNTPVLLAELILSVLKRYHMSIFSWTLIPGWPNMKMKWVHVLLMDNIRDLWHYL